MSLHSTVRRLAVAVLAVSCVSLAFAFPQWRANLAHATGYSYLGCAEDKDAIDPGAFVVFLSDGDVEATEGAPCATELETLLDSCELLDEDSFITDKSPHFAAFYRLFCTTD